jgi:hypothetical protein
MSLDAKPDGTLGPVGSTDSGDRVARAYILGWHMTELYLARLPKRAGQPTPDRRALPSLVSWGDLSAPERAGILMEQVAADLERMHLGEQVTRLTAGIRQSLAAATENNADPFKQAIQDLHVNLLTSLTTADYKLAKAYRLGFALGETALLPVRTGAEAYGKMFDGYRITAILSWLRDLKSCLPAHSSEAVQSSVTTWQSWYADPARGGAVRWQDDKDQQRVRDALRLQGENWRALLSGEKQAVDMLSTSDYVRAAGEMVSHIADLVLRFFRSKSGVALAVVSSLFFVILIILVVAGPGNAVLAAVISLLGALGITSASTGAVVRRALGPVQQALWESDLSTAIASATTRLPPTHTVGTSKP